MRDAAYRCFRRLTLALMVLCLASATRAQQPQQGQKKAPEGVDPKMTSEDKDYGYSEKKPIKVGSKDQFGGPKAERAYLDSLRDEAGKPVKYKRVGSVGKSPDGNIMDLYEVTTSSGSTVKLYFDMYHPMNEPAKQLAPRDFYKVKQ